MINEVIINDKMMQCYTISITVGVLVLVNSSLQINFIDIRAYYFLLATVL